MYPKEREYAKNAFVHGVPSAIAYDIVNTEEGYGVVFEIAGATTAGKYIMAHPDKLKEYAVKFGTLLKTLNSTEADPKLYGNIKDIYRDRLKKTAEYFTGEEITHSTYFDTTAPEKLGLIRNVCGAFSLFRLAATLGMGTERTRANAPLITAMLRERLFPNTDSFCKLFAMPL